MNDILPDEIPEWARLESLLRHMASLYGYREIRFPILEKTELFARSVGHHTDIVEKEMFTFIARNEDSLSLRPEGTAGCVRAGIEHGLLYNQIQRLWYMGPMFRHERPQRGRTRQFHQFGVEVFGVNNAVMDAELIAMNHSIWQQLGLSDLIELQINTLGSLQSRTQYREALVTYLKQHQADLDEDSQRRLETNPLRILDSKNPAMQSLIEKAPSLHDFLDKESQDHFLNLRHTLDKLSIPYTINTRLVRGLDYYCDTVFEFVTTALGAQGTLSAGGRYNGLVAYLGGNDTPAVGFAMGLERVVELLKEKAAQKPAADTKPAVYLVATGRGVMHSLILAQQLRQHLPEITVITDCTDAGFKSQFKRADKSTAAIALVIGDTEAQENTFLLKFLREQDAPQTAHPQEIVCSVVEKALGLVSKHSILSR
jgi:histidyl-tRNA synthetase